MPAGYCGVIARKKKASWQLTIAEKDDVKTSLKEIKEGRVDDELQAKLAKAILKYQSYEHDLLELKQKLRCWYKQEAWFHLPLEVREHFLELLKERDAKP